MEQSKEIQIIMRLLKEQSKKQKDLTDYLGINQNAFTDWKSGRIKSYHKYLDRIADYFGVTVDYLLGKDTEHTSQNELEENTVKYRFKGETVIKTFTEEQMEAISAMIKTIPNIK